MEVDDAGLNPHKNIKESLVTHEELVSTFGVRQQNGWNAIISEFLVVQDYEMFLKLYEDVYAHSPSNDDYLNIFLHGWSVKCKGHIVNYAQYAHDTTQQQLKRVMQPTPLKHKTSSTVTTQNGNQTHEHLGDGGCQDDDCFLIEGMNDFKVFLHMILHELRSF